MNPKYRVFPDYCSTGIWCLETGANLEPEECGLSLIEIVALRYWHSHWEHFPEQTDPEFYDASGEFLEDKWNQNEKRLEYYYKRWTDDGKQIVDSINQRLGQNLFLYDVKY